MSQPNCPLDWHPFDLASLSKSKLSIKSSVHFFSYNRSELAKCKSCMLLLQDDRVVVHGANKNNCLALPSSISQVRGLKNIPELSGKRITKLVAGNSFGVVLLATGRLLAWGLNQFGQLGIGQTRGGCIHKPTEVSQLAAHVVIDVQCGACHVLALTSQHHLFGWGSNTSGAVGNASQRHRFTPVCLTRMNASAGLHPIVSMSAGGWQSAAIDVTGALFLWGTQSTKSEAISTPRLVKSYLDHGERRAGLQVRSVACGRTHVLAITFHGAVIVFGANDQRQCLPSGSEANLDLENVQRAHFIQQPVLLVQAFAQLEISIAVTEQTFYVWGGHDQDWMVKLVQANRLAPNFAKASPTSTLLTCATHFGNLSLNFDEAYLAKRAEEVIVLLVDGEAREACLVNMFNDPQNAEFGFQLNGDFVYLSKRILDSFGQQLARFLGEPSNEFVSEILPRTGSMNRLEVANSVDHNLFLQYLVSFHTGQMMIKERDLVKLARFGEQLRDAKIVKAVHNYIASIENGQLLSHWFDQMKAMDLEAETIKPLVQHFNALLDRADLGRAIRCQMFKRSVRSNAAHVWMGEPYHAIMLGGLLCHEMPVDTSREVFVYYLTFCYLGSDHAAFASENCACETMAQLYRLASHFGNERLEAKCKSIITDRLSIQNVCRLYVVCKEMHIPHLVNVCLAFAKARIAELLASAELRWMASKGNAMLVEFILELNANWNSL